MTKKTTKKNKPLSFLRIPIVPIAIGIGKESTNSKFETQKVLKIKKDDKREEIPAFARIR